MSQMWPFTETAAVGSGARAFAIAGMRHDEIDCAQIYDSFTITVLVTLESLGFCARGEGGAFVESGALAPSGSLPINTDGGGLSSQPSRPPRRVVHDRGRPPAARRVAGRPPRRGAHLPRARHRRQPVRHGDRDPGSLRWTRCRSHARSIDALSAAVLGRRRAEGRLLIQRCERLRRAPVVPARPLPARAARRAGVGRGRRAAASCTRSRSSAESTNPEFAPDTPYVFAIVALEEGVRMAARVVDVPLDDVRCEMPVRVVFPPGDDGHPCPASQEADDADLPRGLWRRAHEFRSVGRTVTESDIMAFAGVSGDFNRLHTDEPWVRENTPFDGSHRPRAAGAGDVERAGDAGPRRRRDDRLPGGDAAVHRARPTRATRSTCCAASTMCGRAARGRRWASSTLDVEVRNQRDEVVQSGRDVWLVARRPEEA